MKLKQLVRDLPIQIRGSKDLQINGICTDSRLVFPGCLFIAKPGARSQGRHFIENAVRSGARAVLTDLFNPFLPACQLIAANPESLEAQLAATYYDFPSRELTCIGITGTNGKTTTSFLLQHLLQNFIGPCGLIGTIHYNTFKSIYDAQHTTPEAALNQKLLREMVQSGCACAAMEVSSHALEQRRTRAIEFDGAIFTNLTHEHLDYHKTGEDYVRAKRRLFEQLSQSPKPRRFAIYNADDPSAEAITADCTAPLISFSLNGRGDLNADDLTFDLNGTRCFLLWNGERVSSTLPLLGAHNVANALAAAAAALALGCDLRRIASLLASAPSPPGRLQRVPNDCELAIFVDFAHTEDALRASLVALRSAAPRAAITVLFGCGGNRDEAKRPKMGAIAAQLADSVIITSDNPRNEDPQKIAAEIAAGLPTGAAHRIQLNRRLAIKEAIADLKRGDLLLIAGKGHEKVQIIGGQLLPLDDIEEVQWACQNDRNPPS